MADTNNTNSPTRPNEPNRNLPRDEPNRRQEGGGNQPGQSTGHDRGLRREPEQKDADGGDIAGVAGGGLDDKHRQ